MAEWEEIRQELEWRRCRDDIFYFARTYWYIQHPERGAILFDLRPEQVATLLVWMGSKLSITLKARQIGFSTLSMLLAFHETYFWPDRFEIGLSRTERDAAKLLKKGKYGYSRLPEWMKARGPKLTADTQSKLSFENGSAIESLPATDPARGESAYRIFVDEWAFFPDPESAWSAIEPAADIGGRITALSTANGSGNLFHQMWVGAVTGVNGFDWVFHSWRAVPEHDDAWYANKARSMQSWQLHQEYPTTPEEAFIKSGNPVFDVDELERMEWVRVAPQGLLLHTHDHEEREAVWCEAEDGPLHIWKQPEPRHKYVIGADVAEGLEHGDFSVAQVIDVATGEIVARWRGHVAPDLFGEATLWFLGWYYNCALVGIEVNNHGLTTCVAMQNRGYPNLYYRYTYDERQSKRGRKVGWRTQVNTKPMAIDELARALRLDGDDAGELKLYDPSTVGELRTYVLEPDTLKMHGSPFDDCVMALAIANQMRKHAFQSQEVDRKDRRWTLEWWLDQDDMDGAQGRRHVIGANNVRR